MAGEPIEGQVLLLTAAKSSVPPTRLPELVDRTQAVLADRRETYRREYERLYEPEVDAEDADVDAEPDADTDADAEFEAYLVEWGHWEELGDEVGLDDRERSAVRRAHEEQLLRVGRREDREGEFETALEIREPVLIGTADGEST